MEANKAYRDYIENFLRDDIDYLHAVEQLTIEYRRKRDKITMRAYNLEGIH